MVRFAKVMLPDVCPSLCVCVYLSVCLCACVCASVHAHHALVDGAMLVPCVRYVFIRNSIKGVSSWVNSFMSKSASCEEWRRAFYEIFNSAIEMVAHWYWPSGLLYFSTIRERVSTLSSVLITRECAFAVLVASAVSWTGMKIPQIAKSHSWTK